MAGATSQGQPAGVACGACRWFVRYLRDPDPFRDRGSCMQVSYVTDMPGDCLGDLRGDHGCPHHGRRFEEIPLDVFRGGES